ncbi:timeless protein-domain-containing protein [Amylostereum chailletii]|nr:timeless protein-domain-containing protein [Amylostereum chailletii]
MDRDDVISIHSDESNEEQYGAKQRRAILEPAIRNVVDALGGYEGGTYRMGDEAYGCLKDLKKYWRKDDTDDDRLVARIFWEARLLPNDLVPILLETAGKGHVEDKRAIACTDLITAMTWPIDLAEELKELDDEMDRGVDYTQLLQSHLYYKAALLRPGVLAALLNVVLPCLARDAKQRTERDAQVVNVVLHLVRNLAFIKDPPSNVHSSADQIDLTNMQSKLVKTLSDTHFLDVISTIASNAVTNVMFNRWNTLVLEIYYLLFRGVKPGTLVLEQSVQTTRNLRQLLTIEGQRRRDFARNAPSRHSRFGTTITVKLNPKKPPPETSASGEPLSAAEPPSSRGFVLHKQQAINTDSGTLIDSVKRQQKQKGKKADELGREESLSTESRTLLQGFARTFIESCFNPFLASLLKDIKSERPKVTEKDNLRLLFVTRWFLQFFLATRAKEGESGSENSWDFGLVGEVIERGWIVWILKRMNGAVEEKPKLWTELQAGIECLTQLLALIDAMSSTKGSSELLDAANLLQQQLIYNGQVLDAALEGLRAYKEGTQALAFLDASVHLAYSAMRMLEKWGKAKGENSYVRKRAKSHRRRKDRGQDADGVPDVEGTEAPVEDDVIEETLFTLEAYELKFANSEITHSLVMYLTRYKEFDSSECIKRVVNLIHRQVVRAKAEGLYYQVSTLDLFKSILGDRKSFPQEQPYKDLVALITYILRQFFKAVESDSFVLIEAFFPKNRGQWKKLSSWKPEEKERASRKTAEGSKHPPDVQVKKGYTWSQQVAIAMAALEDANQGDLIEWTKDILTLVIAQRKRIIEEVDGVKEDAPLNEEELDDNAIKAKLQPNIPSEEASAKITDYLIPYISDEQAEAATKNPPLKLLFRLVHFYIQEEDADELDWYIPAGILVSDLQQSLNVIDQFQKNPIDLEGKRAAQLLHKKRSRRTRRRETTPTSDAELPDDSDEEPRAKLKERKKKEKEHYKSAQFVEDSDDDDDLEAFFARERELRERTTLAAVNSALGIGTMRKTGTKKRRRKATETSRKRRKGSEQPEDEGSQAGLSASGSGSDVDVPADNVGQSPQGSRASPAKATSSDGEEAEVVSVRPRPRPRPRMKARVEGSQLSTETNGGYDMASKRSSPVPADVANVDVDVAEPASPLAAPARRRNVKTRVVFSDEED